MPSAEIEVLNGPLKGTRLGVAGDSVRIGRGSECEVRLEGYEQVSRQHATLRWDGSKYRLEDAGSKNGVFLGEKRISAANMIDGTEFRLGDCNLKFIASPEPALITEAKRPNVAIFAGIGVVVILAMIALIFASTGRDNAAKANPQTGPQTGPKVDVVAKGPTDAPDGKPADNGPAQAPKKQVTEADLETIAKSVVLIQSLNASGSGAEGTGFCFGRSDLVLTNAHVALGGATKDAQGQVVQLPAEIGVVLDAGKDSEREVAAQLVAVDQGKDLAVLKLSQGHLATLDPGDTTTLKPLEKVVAIGFPKGSMLGARSHGAPEVSYISLEVQQVKTDDDGQPRFLQVGGSITHGNSGGPVISPEGTVVGITTAMVTDSSIGICIPSNVFNRYVDKVKAQLDARESDTKN
jgi:S1-C subfamily serine protease